MVTLLSLADHIQKNGYRRGQFHRQLPQYRWVPRLEFEFDFAQRAGTATTQDSALIDRHLYKRFTPCKCITPGTEFGDHQHLPLKVGFERGLQLVQVRLT